MRGWQSAPYSCLDGLRDCFAVGRGDAQFDCACGVGSDLKDRRLIWLRQA
ncbi:MAG: hypothetical protein U0528_12055 [Anaerolineae bacterium]